MKKTKPLKFANQKLMQKRWKTPRSLEGSRRRNRMALTEVFRPRESLTRYRKRGIFVAGGRKTRATFRNLKETRCKLRAAWQLQVLQLL